MEAIEFKEQTVIIAENQPEYNNLPAKITKIKETNTFEIETHWNLSDNELIDIAKSRILIIKQILPINQNYNPISLIVKKQ